MITISKTNKVVYGQMKWVLKARSKDEIKPVFTKVLITEEREIICCDSRRAHIISDPECFFKDVAPGLYDLIKEDSKEIILNESELSAGEYPNIKQIIPKEESVEFIGTYSTGTENYMVGISLAKLYRDFYYKNPEGSFCMNFDFFKDTMAGNEFSVFLMKEQGERYMRPIMFKAGSFNGDYSIAVIMPMPVECKSEMETKKEEVAA